MVPVLPTDSVKLDCGEGDYSSGGNKSARSPGPTSRSSTDSARGNAKRNSFSGPSPRVGRNMADVNANSNTSFLPTTSPRAPSRGEGTRRSTDRGGYGGGNSNPTTPRARAKSITADDDMSVISLSSNAGKSTKATRKNSISTTSNGGRRNSISRKKRVSFRTPIADYCEHTADFSIFSAGDDNSFSEDYNVDPHAKGIPRRRSKRDKYGMVDDGQGIGCSCCIMS